MKKGVYAPIFEGDKVGNFIFIRETEKVSGNRRCDVKCRCGKIFNVAWSEVKYRGQKTCGCIWKDYMPHTITHGATGTKEHNAWKSIRKRCNQVNSKSYKDYGGAGIKMCQEWNDFSNFLKDMGKAPSKLHSIDRIKNNLGYFKENCRWASPKEQAVNRKTTIYLTYRGGTATIEHWAKWTGLSRTTIERRRDRKWSDEKILTTPKLINHV